MNNHIKPIGPYSTARRAGDLLFCSGQIGIDGSGALVAGGIASETRQAFENLKEALREEGFTLQDVVKATVYLKDMNEFAAMNAVYQEYFNPPYPARATIQVAALPKGACIEIEAVAVKG
ncbi:MAG: Rid family detoxifying hydrolase [Patescibacteria group bacterium]